MHIISSLFVGFMITRNIEMNCNEGTTPRRGLDVFVSTESTGGLEILHGRSWMSTIPDGRNLIPCPSPTVGQKKRISTPMDSHGKVKTGNKKDPP
jgi:hypothetical protein